MLLTQLSDKLCAMHGAGGDWLGQQGDGGQTQPAHGPSHAIASEAINGHGSLVCGGGGTDGGDDAVRLIVKQAVALCERSSGRLPDAQAVKLWFDLLDLVVHHSLASGAAAVQGPGDLVQQVTREVVRSAGGHVSLPRLVNRYANPWLCLYMGRR